MIINNSTLWAVLFSLAAVLIISYFICRSRSRNSYDYYLASQSVGPLLSAASLTSGQCSLAAFIVIVYCSNVEVVFTVINGALMGLISFAIAYVPYREIRKHTYNNSYSFLSVIKNINAGEGSRYIFAQQIAYIIFISVIGVTKIIINAVVINAVVPVSEFAIIALIFSIALFCCWIGGIRAVIMAGAVSFCLMALAVIITFIVLLNKFGTGYVIQNALRLDDPYFLRWNGTRADFIAFLLLVNCIISAMGSYVYPPSVLPIVSLKNARSVFRANFWNYGFLCTIFLLSVGIGVICRSVGFGLHGKHPLTLGMDIVLFSAGGIVFAMMLASLFIESVKVCCSLAIAISSSICNDMLDIASLYKESRVTTIIAMLILAALVIMTILILGSNVMYYHFISTQWSHYAACFFGVYILILCYGYNYGYKFNGCQLLATGAVGCIALTIYNVINTGDNNEGGLVISIALSVITYFVMRHFRIGENAEKLVQ